MIRVMLIDDSPLFLGVMQHAIDSDPQMQVACTARNGQEGLDKVGLCKPDVIVCDVQMPKMSGIEFLQNLLPKYPLPVVVISSTPGITLSALQNGAVDFIPKPAPGEDKNDFFMRLRLTIRTAASANIKAKLAMRNRPAPVNAAATPRVAFNPLAGGNNMVIAIGASTGGTDAILEVVRLFPANFPGVVITQHMPAGFTAMYAERLNKECKMQVSEAKDGQRLERGQIILAAGEHQMKLERDTAGYYVTSRRGEKVSGHIPSVDVLFDSVARTAKNRAVGIILTGMGGDGSDGLLKMRQAGAYTIGQDKETCVVYGMPMVAFNKGAVQKQLPLQMIAGEVMRYLNGVK